MRIQYAFFLSQHMKRKTESNSELTFTQQFQLSFEEQFIIFRSLKQSEDYDDVGESSGGTVDVVAKFAYDAALRQF